MSCSKTYGDKEILFSPTVKFIKLDVNGSNQIRINYMKVEFETVTEIVSSFVNTYMHMSENVTGQCNTYYLPAKQALVALGSEAITEFTTNTDFADAKAIGALPKPASFENIPLEIPCLIAIIIPIPARPPAADLKSNADLNISTKALGTAFILNTIKSASVSWLSMENATEGMPFKQPSMAMPIVPE